MSALKNSRNKLNIEEALSKESSSRIERFATPSGPLSRRNTEELFENLNSFRDDIRKKINEKLKCESKPLNRNPSKTAIVSNPGAVEGTRGLVSIQIEQTTSIYADLLNAMRGSNSSKAQNPSAKSNSLGGFSSLKEEIFKKKAVELKDSQVVPKAKPTQDNSAKSLSLKASAHSFKENLTPNTVNTPLGDKNKSVAALRTKISDLKKSLHLQDENKFFQSNQTDSSVLTGTGLEQGNNAKENLSKIFDNMERNRTPGSKAVAAHKGNSLFDLSEELERIRYQGRKELEKTPFEKLTSRNLSRGINLMTPTATDCSFSKIFDKSPISIAEEDGGSKLDRKINSFTETVSLTRVYDFQNALNQINIPEFNSLPTTYVEELVKLSSMIMQKVKDSRYYAKQSRF